MNMNIQYIRRPHKQLSHLVFPLSQAHEEIIWFNIPVEKRFRMHKLNTFDLAKEKRKKDKSLLMDYENTNLYIILPTKRVNHSDKNCNCYY